MMNRDILRDGQSVVYYVVKEGSLEISQKFTNKMVAEQQMATMPSRSNIRVAAVDSDGRELLLG